MQTSWERSLSRGGSCLGLQGGEKHERLAVIFDSHFTSSFIDSFISLLGFTYNCLSQVLFIHGKKTILPLKNADQKNLISSNAWIQWNVYYRLYKNCMFYRTKDDIR